MNLNIGQVAIYGDTLEVLRKMPDKCVDAIIDDAPYGKNIAGLGEIPPREVLTESLRISRGAVITFATSHVWCLRAYTKYNPPPDRMLIWSPEFKLGAIQSSQMIFRTHTIWCWNLPKKQYIKRINFDILRHCTATKHMEFEHKGAKPIPLMKDLLAAFCPVKGTVLDRYCGSGTTLLAAKELGMLAIGIDRDPYSIDITRRRLYEADKQVNLFT